MRPTPRHSTNERKINWTFPKPWITPKAFVRALSGICIFLTISCVTTSEVEEPAPASVEKEEVIKMNHDEAVASEDSKFTVAGPSGPETEFKRIHFNRKILNYDLQIEALEFPNSAPLNEKVHAGIEEWEKSLKVLFANSSSSIQTDGQSPFNRVEIEYPTEQQIKIILLPYDEQFPSKEIIIDLTQKS